MTGWCSESPAFGKLQNVGGHCIRTVLVERLLEKLNDKTWAISIIRNFMKNKILSFLFLVFGIGQTIVILLFSMGMLRRINDLKEISIREEWARQESLAFKIILVLMLVLFGFSLYGTIKKKKIPLLIPAILALIGYLSKFWWFGD